MTSLCETCRHLRDVRTGRSRFLLCGLSASDARYPRYPPQPIVRCDGYHQQNGTGMTENIDRGLIARDWTAEELAREVGASRSAFAERFSELMGVPPMKYLTGWRMQVATERLRETQRSIAQIAAEVGYESEVAFARAFKREHSESPAQWRRRLGKS